MTKKASLAPVVSRRVSTPLGSLFLAAAPAGLVSASFNQHRLSKQQANSRASQTKKALRVLDTASSCIKEYFRGSLTSLKEVSVQPQGTPFQLRVWQRMRKIKAGNTISYSELARATGHLRAARAAGAACKANPLALFIPCHRVIGKDQRLTGYSAGLMRKAYLLNHERTGFDSLIR